MLACGPVDLASGASFEVIVSGETDAADCGVVDNTAEVTTTNAGSTEDSASVEVLCPDLTVEKRAGASPVNAGDPVSFTIVVTNLGPGTAFDVTLTDNLPAGVDWAITEDTTAGTCSISGAVGSEVLECGPVDLGDDAFFSVTVSGTTDAADCAGLTNTATADASNDEPVTSAPATTIDVNCPDLEVVKEAGASPISAGDTASFTITVTNTGEGTAYGATLSDTLPAGVAWAETADSDGVCAVAGGVLSCGPVDLPAGESFSVTVAGVTDAADCGELENTATASGRPTRPRTTSRTTATRRRSPSSARMSRSSRAPSRRRSAPVRRRLSPSPSPTLATASPATSP